VKRKESVTKTGKGEDLHKELYRGKRVLGLGTWV
jgi:predicted nicotinamide N-methyase